MSSKLTRRVSQLALLATVMGLAASPVTAQIIPDAGQTLRDNRQPVTPVPPQALPTLSVPDETDSTADPGQRLSVASIRIEGAYSLPADALHGLVADLEGRELSLGELRAGIRRITSYYRQRGYIVARAFIPSQEVESGVVRVRILEGRLSGTQIANGSKVGDRTIQAILDAQKLTGRTITASGTDRALLLIADLPSVGKVAGKLKPGADVGTSDLVVTAEAGKRIDGSISADNYGNRYTGQNRLNGRLDLNSPTGRGDRLSAQASLTDENLLYGRLAYDLPVGGDGLRAGAALSTSSYELGQEFAMLDATGTARTAGVYALYPLLRSLNRNMWLSGNVETRDLEDRIDAVNTVTKKSATVATFGLYGDMQDAWLGGGYTTWSLSFIQGDLSIDTPAAQAIDKLGPKTEGEYRKVSLSVSRLQAITSRTSLSVALAGQTASQNLDSSEKFVIGGSYGVRAYPQGEGAGDTGWLGNVELRHQLAANLQLAAFYDAGQVRLNKNPYVASDRKTDSLSGYGLSLAAQRGRVNGKLTVAWRASDEKPRTAPDKSPRIWGSVGYSF